MVSFEDEDDNGSQNSSEEENDLDEAMDDVDEGDADADADGEGDGDADADDLEDPEADNDEEEGENEDEEEQDEVDSPTNSRLTARQPARHSTSPQPLPNGTAAEPPDNTLPAVSFTSPSPRPSSGMNIVLPYRPSIRPEAFTAYTYDIVPTIAAPQSTSINAVTATPDMRWVFSGGTDGYIRKFHWPDSANGKVPLTVAQRHPFVDSVVKAGVLSSYWENEDTSDRTPQRHLSDEPVATSPVYSLAVHNQALWLLSGTETGGINLQTVRHSEGTRITTLKKHTSAVSVLHLARDEQSVLSGSWDKTIHDWDLNTGQVKRSFSGSGTQISAIEPRPMSNLPVPEESESPATINGTYSSNNAAPPRANGIFANGMVGDGRAGVSAADGTEDAPGEPDDDMNSLFGDDEDAVVNGDASMMAFSATTEPTANGAPDTTNEPPSMPGLDEDDDEFSRAIANGLQEDPIEGDADGDTTMVDATASSGGPVQPPAITTNGAAAQQAETIINGLADSSSEAVQQNGLPHFDSPKMNGILTNSSTTIADQELTSDTTFLDASINGTIHIWDRRQPNPVARIMPPRGTPPWCMSACWSPDGNFIYTGRRNNSVEEYSLHRGFREGPRRTFRFPAGSGSVSSVRAMPNGRHLICASYDILRLYNLNAQEQPSGRHSTVPFLIVPGHRTGVISQLYIDPSCTFLISTAGNRGWEGSSTEVLLGYEIGVASKVDIK